MTPEEADRAYEEAPSIAISDEEIDRLVEVATKPLVIRYGVKFKTMQGEYVSDFRFREWKDAAKLGESEVHAKRATGFWVFQEPSASST